MESPEILAIKSTMQTSGRKHIEKELVRKREEIDDKIQSFLVSSSCIFDEKAYREITKLTFEKSIIDMFLKTPLEIINRLDIAI